METQLVQLVEHYLSLHLHDNALFFAERLFAESPSEANRHLLASTHVLAGRKRQAATILTGGHSLVNRFLYARCLVDLEQYRDAEDSLFKAAGMTLANGRLPSDVRSIIANPQKVPGGPAGLYLLGVCAHRTVRHDRAIELYRAALNLDPFLWTAFEALVSLGAAPDPQSSFASNRVEALSHPSNSCFSSQVDVSFDPYHPQPLSSLGRGASMATAKATAVAQGKNKFEGRAVTRSNTSPAEEEDDDDYMESMPSSVNDFVLVVPSPLPSPITPAAKLMMATTSSPLPSESEIKHRDGTPKGRNASHMKQAPPSATTFVLARSLAGVGISDMTTPAVAQRLWPGVARVHPAFSSFPGSTRSVASTGVSGSTFNGILAAPHLEQSQSPSGTNISDASAARLAESMFTFSLSSPSVPPPVPGDYFNGGVVRGGRASAFFTPAASATPLSLQRRPRRGRRARASAAVSGGGRSATSGPGNFRSTSFALSEIPQEEEDDEDVSRVIMEGDADLNSSTPGGGGGGMILSTPSAIALAIAPGPAGIVMSRRNGQFNLRSRSMHATQQRARVGGDETVSMTTASSLSHRSHGDVNSVASSSPIPSNISLILSDGSTPHQNYNSFVGLGGIPASAIAGNLSVDSHQSTTAADGIASRLKRQPARLDFVLGGMNADVDVSSISPAGASVPASERAAPPPDVNFDGSTPPAASAMSFVPAPPRKAVGTTNVPLPRAVAIGSGGDSSTSSTSTSPSKNLKRSLLDSQEQSSSPTIDSEASPGIGANTAHISSHDDVGLRPLRDTNAANGLSRPSLHDSLQRSSKLVLALLRNFGSALRLLGEYQCKQAISELHALPQRQRGTGWAQCMLGRAYYESAQYVRAKKAFEEMRLVAPERMEGLEIYSSVLWHLRLNSELVHLSQEVLAYDKNSPQTWCVLANAVSAQRDHTRALLYLRKALQVDKHCVYAHALRGHECVSSGDLDAATASFREAISQDPRSYNAWYGLGTIFFQQQRHTVAEAHFRKAASFHPRSPVLHTYLGMALAASEKYTEALTVLKQACELDRTNSQARFQMAQVHLFLGQPDLARNELLIVHEANPREPSVLVALGKACKRAGYIDEAIRFLNLALEIHSGGSLQSSTKRNYQNAAAGKGDAQANKIRELLANVRNAGVDDESDWA
jgi:tetratricopeptide (TPR) repeat protein